MILNTENIRAYIDNEQEALCEAIYKEAVIDYLVLYFGFDYDMNYKRQILGLKIASYWTKERLRDWLLNSVIAQTLYKDPEKTLLEIERKADEVKSKGEAETFIKTVLKRKSIVERNI